MQLPRESSDGLCFPLAFPLAKQSWEEMGTFSESPPCLLLHSNEMREEVFPLKNKKSAAIGKGMEVSQLECDPELCCGRAYSQVSIPLHLGERASASGNMVQELHSPVVVNWPRLSATTPEFRVNKGKGFGVQQVHLFPVAAPRVRGRTADADMLPFALALLRSPS